jgi:hypothetical protein
MAPTLPGGFSGEIQNLCAGTAPQRGVAAPGLSALKHRFYHVPASNTAVGHMILQNGSVLADHQDRCRRVCQHVLGLAAQ